MTDPREFMFDVLLASNRLADGVLEADRKAAAGREFYDDGYFDGVRDGSVGVHGAAAQRLDHGGGLDHHRRLGAGGRPAIPPDAPRKPRPIPPSARLRNRISSRLSRFSLASRHGRLSDPDDHVRALRALLRSAG